MFGVQCGFLFFGFVLAACFVREGSSLVCYHCTDADIPDCQDPFIPNPMFTMECGYGQVCVKHRTEDLLMPAITNRGCMSRDYCNNVEDISEYCEMCTTDFCNSSSVVLPSFLIVILVAVKGYLL